MQKSRGGKNLYGRVGGQADQKIPRAETCGFHRAHYPGLLRVRLWHGLQGLSPQCAWYLRGEKAMTRLAIIGGSGLTALEGLVIQRKQMQPTPYGAPPGPPL